MTVEQLYEHHVKGMKVEEQLQLVDHITRGLSTQDPTEQKYDWMAVRGIAPDPFGGEDPQEWVSRTRRESSEHRESQWSDA